MKFVKIYPFQPNVEYSEEYKNGVIINTDHIVCIHCEQVQFNNSSVDCYNITISCGQFLSSIRTIILPVTYSDASHLNI